MRKDVELRGQIGKGIRILGLMFIISSVLLMILSALLYRWELAEGHIAIGIIAIYIISSFIGGFLIGKCNKVKKYIWGFVMGLSYYIVLMIITLVINKGMSDYNIVTSMIMCMCSGMLGGMIS